MTAENSRLSGVVAWSSDFPDAEAFCARVRAHAFFAPDLPIGVGRAPGRFDVLGGIADYSGSLVLELPTACAALVAAQHADDGRVVAVSGNRRISLPAGELFDVPIERLAERLSGADVWAAYVLGPVALLARECRLSLPGLRLLVSSSVPEGKGLASSAAVEVASAQAVGCLLGRTFEPRALALLAQRAEQSVAGAPCGAMDQTVVACGEEGRLLAVACRPAEVVDSIELPSPLTVWGIDSGIHHAVAGDNYRRVRCAAFMGKALLGRENGYLAVLNRRRVDVDRLPEQLSGAEFLRLRQRVEDRFSTIEPEAVYPVRAATAHPIDEQVRVQAFAHLLTKPVTARRAGILGELMYESHAGYSSCGLGTPTTDAIVSAVRAVGWDGGLAGARVSGGGSGGTVVVLGSSDAEPDVRAIAERLGAGLVAGSSPGAAVFGGRVLEPSAGPAALPSPRSVLRTHVRAARRQSLRPRIDR